MIQKLDNGYIVNINKPVEWTSFDVVKKIRNITRIKRVGHAGTLDPFATGVLLICMGKATKNVAALMNLKKEYEAILRLGQTTDTLDLTGKITEEKPVPEFDKHQLNEIFRQFTGTIQQKIPAYSAAKIGGRRSYALARKGVEIPDRFKTVTIYCFKLLDFRASEIHFAVECGQGTYIRTLAYDIAVKLGTTGHLTRLTRKRIGDYHLEQSLSLNLFEKHWQAEKHHGNN